LQIDTALHAATPKRYLRRASSVAEIAISVLMHGIATDSLRRSPSSVRSGCLSDERISSSSRSSEGQP
jgi:hypothetical protein